jgi:clan AA aspartic protease
MGLTHVTVRVSPLAAKGRRAFEAEFLVDTGSIDCLVPRSALEPAGVKVEGKDVYERANGQTAEYPYGHARISFLGSSTVSRVIFGPEDVEPILGVVALESTGIAVDPVSKTLKRMAAKPLKTNRGRVSRGRV